MPQINVTDQDVVRFHRNLLQRAWVNLEVAQKRGDKRAVRNIERKIVIYTKVVQKFGGGEDLVKSITGHN